MSNSMKTTSGIDVFGIRLTPCTADEVVSQVQAAINERRGLTVANMNVHGLYLYHSDTSFQQYCDQADLTIIDGFPLLPIASWKARKLANSPRYGATHRVGSTDWLSLILKAGGGQKVLAIGGTPTSAREAARRIRRDYKVNWEAVDGYALKHQGEGPARELDYLVAESDLIIVGMGMPIQESWILANRDLLANKVVPNVGGCIDYYSGQQSLAPRYLGALGLEWAFRLLKDPKRLWRRYLLEPLQLALILLRKRL